MCIKTLSSAIQTNNTFDRIVILMKPFSIICAN